VPHARRTPRLSTALRKTVKWGGAVATVVLVAVWVTSGRYCAYWVFRGESEVFVGGGNININLGNFWSVMKSPPGWYAEAQESSLLCRPRLLWNSYSLFADIPLWLLLGPSMALTLWAWRRDAVLRRRACAEFCPKCHYDRAGLAADAVCPECGTPASTPPQH
jgi:hypothetical protein